MATKNKSEKYWTCFGRHDKDTKHLHMTHKFLGQLSEDDFKKICSLIQVLTASEKAIEVNFDKKEDFGFQNEIPAITARDHVFSEGFQKLRSELNHYRDDDFEEYVPHVSYKEAPEKMIFNRYFLMKGSEIICSEKLA